MAREFVGGQAVVEGVLMMRSDKYAVAVRGPKGIKIKHGRLPLNREFWMRIPVLRGIVLLLTTLFVGIRAMAWGASVSDDEEFTAGMLFWTILLSLFIALLLFKVLPLLLADFLVSRQETVLFNLVDGLVRIFILIAYLALIGRTKDVKRLFAYHGAEHKVINAYEKTGKLLLGASREASRLHVRCSTSFVVLVLVVAVVVFAIVPLTLPFWMLLFVRLLLVLPIAGASWEIIRFIGLHADNKLLRPIIAPGFWVQKLTTREPNDEELKVAIAALRAVLK